MTFCLGRAPVERHYGRVQRHGLTIKQTQTTNEIIDRRIGVIISEACSFSFEEAQFKMHHGSLPC